MLLRSICILLISLVCVPFVSLSVNAGSSKENISDQGRITGISILAKQQRIAIDGREYSVSSTAKISKHERPVKLRHLSAGENVIFSYRAKQQIKNSKQPLAGDITKIIVVDQ